MSETSIEPPLDGTPTTERAAVGEIRDALHSYMSAGWVTPRRGMVPAEFNIKALFWIRLIGAIITTWAIATIALGIWIGIEVAGDDSSSNPAYEECLFDDTTTADECRRLK